MTELSLLTYNIHKGFSFGNFKFVLPAMKKALITIDPDILCLQEVQGQQLHHRKNIKDWPRKRQHNYLADPHWEHVIYGKNAHYAHGHHGNALLSKLNIIHWENMDVSNQKFSSRSILHGTLALPNATKTVHVMCVHFGLFRKEQGKQLEMLCKRIQEHVPDHEPLIIAGDFNDWLKKADKELRNILHLKEIFKETTGCYAKTFPAWQPLLTVDRIYYRGLTPVHYACLTGKPWITLSDHIPLYAKFKLEE